MFTYIQLTQMVIPFPLNRWWGWLFSELFLEEYLIAESAAMVIQTRASAFIVILLYAMSRYEIGELTELQQLCTYTTFIPGSFNIASGGGGLCYYELLGHPFRLKYHHHLTLHSRPMIKMDTYSKLRMSRNRIAT